MMPQFEFYGTWDDSWQILGDITSHLFFLIPDRWYESSEIPKYNSLNNELKSTLRLKRRVFLWNQDFSVFSPGVRLQKAGSYSGKYQVGAEYGGPCLALTLPACSENENKLNLSCGQLTYPKEFLHPETGNWVPASEKLKSGYKNVIVLIKKSLIKHKSKTAIWIGKNASQLLEQQKAEIRDKWT